MCTRKILEHLNTNCIDRMVIALGLLLALVGDVFCETTRIEVTQSWNGGFHGNYYIVASSHTLNGWTAHVKCNKALTKFEVGFHLTEIIVIALVSFSRSVSFVSGAYKILLTKVRILA